MQFAVVDNCPVPQDLAEELEEIKRRTGATLNSCDRSPDAEPLLQQFGKMSQRQLFEGFVARRPGFNPANPPGRSTHERRNDGVAYFGPAGMPLRYWQVGMDWSDSAAVMAAARERGWVATLTYPGNPREGHHVNFRREPNLPRTRTMKVGTRGPDVLLLQKRLSQLCSPFDGDRYLAAEPKGFSNVFGEKTAEAVRRFQREHKLTEDGVYGEQTHAQLMVARRRQETPARDGAAPRWRAHRPRLAAATAPQEVQGQRRPVVLPTPPERTLRRRDRGVREALSERARPRGGRGIRPAQRGRAARGACEEVGARSTPRRPR